MTTAALSRITGLSADKMKSIFAEVQANQKKLIGCPRHRFEADTVSLGDKLTCNACGGTMGITDAAHYADGYIAAGGDAKDVWPAYSSRTTKVPS